MFYVIWEKNDEIQEFVYLDFFCEICSCKLINNIGVVKMKVSSDQHWNEVLALISKNVSAQQYATWFKPIVFESFNEKTRTILVQVPSLFVYEYLEENYVDLLKTVLSRVFGEGIRLTYRVVTDQEHKLTQDIEADPQMPRSLRNKRLAPISHPLFSTQPFRNN